MLKPILAAKRSLSGPLASVSGGAGLPAAWGQYHFKGAASQAASYLDLSGNGNDLTVGVAPTWNSTDGLIFNASTQYMRTGFVPSLDQSQTVLVQFTNGPATDRSLFGSVGVGARASFNIRPSSSGSVLYFNGFQSLVSPAASSGNLAIAGNLAYRNGVDEGVTIGVWNATSAAEVYLGCRNNNGTADNFTSAYVQAFYIYDIVLTGPEVAAVVAVMAAL